MKFSWHSDSEPKSGDSEALIHPAAETGCGGSLWNRVWATPLSDLLRGRMSCRYDVRAIVGVSGLPEAVCDRVLDTVKRTRLMRCEKAGIAGDLVAHFADGIEGGASPDEMLSDFGDVRTAAKLMRRAKLRCRAWPRRAMRRTGQALGVLLVVYAVAAVYYATGRPKVSVDYLARMNAEALALPEKDRAWPVYRQALLELDRDRAEELLRPDTPEPGSAEWNEVVRLVGDSQIVLATARRAVNMDHFGYVYGTDIREENRKLWPEQYAGQEGDEPSELWLADTPETCLIGVQSAYLFELRKLARLFSIDAAIGTEKANADRVNADIEALLGITRHLRSQDMLIGQLVAISILRKTIDATAEVLRLQPELLTDAQLRRLAHAFGSGNLHPIIRIDSERLWFDDFLQRIYTDDGHGDGHLVPGAISAMQMIRAGGYDRPKRSVAEIATTPLANAIVASRKDMMAYCDRIVDRNKARFAMPYWEVYRSGSNGDEVRSEMSIRQKLRYWFFASGFPSFEPTYRMREDVVGRLDGLLVALALEVYRRRQGGWPERLDELVPDLLPSVPRDRFTGEPLCYRIDGGEALVYSVGQDLDDDGGVLPEAPAAPDQSPRERFRKMNHQAGPRSDESSDGDWILWHSSPFSDLPIGPRDQGGSESAN